MQKYIKEVFSDFNKNNNLINVFNIEKNIQYTKEEFEKIVNKQIEEYDSYTNIAGVATIESKNSIDLEKVKELYPFDFYGYSLCKSRPSYKQFRSSPRCGNRRVYRTCSQL